MEHSESEMLLPPPDLVFGASATTSELKTSPPVGSSPPLVPAAAATTSKTPEAPSPPMSESNSVFETEIVEKAVEKVGAVEPDAIVVDDSPSRPRTRACGFASSRRKQRTKFSRMKGRSGKAERSSFEVSSESDASESSGALPSPSKDEAIPAPLGTCKLPPSEPYYSYPRHDKPARRSYMSAGGHKRGNPWPKTPTYNFTTLNLDREKREAKPRSDPLPTLLQTNAASTQYQTNAAPIQAQKNTAPCQTIQVSDDEKEEVDLVDTEYNSPFVLPDRDSPTGNDSNHRCQTRRMSTRACKEPEVVEVLDEVKVLTHLETAYDGPTHLIFMYPPGKSRGQIKVTAEERGRLEQRKYTNDSLIDFYLRYQEVEDLARRHDSVRLTTKFLSSFFFGIVRRTKPIAYNAVKGWTKGSDIFKTDIIMTPICDSFHWSLLIVINLREVGRLLRDNTINLDTAGPKIIYLDSLDTKRGNEFGDTMRRYLVEEWLHRKQDKPITDELRRDVFSSFKKIIPTLKPISPIQDNEYDCGLYVMNNLTMFLGNNDNIIGKILKGESIEHIYTPADIQKLRLTTISLMNDLEKEYNRKKEVTLKSSTNELTVPDVPLQERMLLAMPLDDCEGVNISPNPTNELRNESCGVDSNSETNNGSSIVVVAPQIEGAHDKSSKSVKRDSFPYIQQHASTTTSIRYTSKDDMGMDPVLTKESPPLVLESPVANVEEAAMECEILSKVAQVATEIVDQEKHLSAGLTNDSDEGDIVIHVLDAQEGWNGRDEHMKELDDGVQEEEGEPRVRSLAPHCDVLGGRKEAQAANTPTSRSTPKEKKGASVSSDEERDNFPTGYGGEMDKSSPEHEIMEASARRHSKLFVLSRKKSNLFGANKPREHMLTQTLASSDAARIDFSMCSRKSRAPPRGDVDCTRAIDVDAGEGGIDIDGDGHRLESDASAGDQKA